MKLQLNNGTELNTLCVNGSSRYFQGQSRDSLEIQLQKGIKTFEELDVLFSDSTNTKKLKIIDGETEFIHDNYTLRVEMSLRSIITAQETSTTPEVTEERVCIVLAQKTYMEIQLDAILGNG